MRTKVRPWLPSKHVTNKIYLSFNEIKPIILTSIRHSHACKDREQ